VIDPKTKVKQRDAMARRRKPSQIARKRVRRFVQIEPYVDRPLPHRIVCMEFPEREGLRVKCRPTCGNCAHLTDCERTFGRILAERRKSTP
jgi:hypothetical protein